MKKYLLVVMAALFLLSSCGSIQEGNSKEEGTSVAEQNSEEEQGNAGNTEEHEKEGENVLPSIEEEFTQGELLEVLIADHYLDENSNGESDITNMPEDGLCSVSWQSLTLGKESREKFPKLAEGLEQKNKETAMNFQNFLEENLPLAKQHYTDMPEFFSPYRSNSSQWVQRADSLILSILEEGSEYTGGAHGMYGVWGSNYDPSTGEEMVLTDICTKVEELPAVLSEKVIEDYADEYENFQSLQSILEEYQSEDYNWTMGDRSVTFYFNPYEIASYAMGVIKVTLWFDEYPELFHEKFLEKIQSGYIVAIPMDQELEIDLNYEEKGKLKVSTYYETEEEEEYGIRRLSITLNGNSYREEEAYGYDFYPYLVCVNDLEEEQYYLYVQEIAENDYSTLSVYHLQNGEIIRNDRISGVGFSGEWEEMSGEYGTYFKYAVADPKAFELGTRLEILGTWNGKRSYSVNTKSGIPQPATESFSLTNTHELTLSKIPIEVIILPEQKKEEVPAKTEFEFIRTDGKSYVDARLTDGRECRIFVEFEDYTQTINGVDQWDCFENLFYAG